MNESMLYTNHSFTNIVIPPESNWYNKLAESLLSMNIDGVLINPFIQVLIFVFAYLTIAAIHEFGHLIVMKTEDKNSKINLKKGVYTSGRVSNRTLAYSAINGIILGYMGVIIWVITFLASGAYFHVGMIFLSYMLGIRKDMKIIKEIRRNESRNISENK